MQPNLILTNKHGKEPRRRLLERKVPDLPSLWRSQAAFLVGSYGEAIVGHRDRREQAGSRVVCHRAEQKRPALRSETVGLCQRPLPSFLSLASFPAIGEPHLLCDRHQEKPKDHDSWSQVNFQLVEADNSCFHRELSQEVESPVDAISVQSRSS